MSSFLKKKKKMKTKFKQQITKASFKVLEMYIS